MAPTLSFLISPGPKKKEPRCACLSDAKASHSHKMWTEVSSSTAFPTQPHYIYKCLLKVLSPVSRPIRTLDCVLLKDNNLALVARSGPEINSPACSLCTTQTMPQYQMLFFHPVFHLSSYILPRDPPRKAHVQQTIEQNRPLRACQGFHFLLLRHVQGLNIAPQCVR